MWSILGVRSLLTNHRTSGGSTTLWTWLGVGLALALPGCNRSPANASSQAGPGAARPASLVRVTSVVSEEVAPETIVTGTVIARRTSVVASGSEGKVDTFDVREGDIVEANQQLSVLNMVTTDLGIQEAEKILQERESMLAELKSGSRVEEVAEVKARMEGAEVTMKVMADKYNRMARIVKESGGSQNDLDDAREKAEAAQKMYLAAKAQSQLVVAGPRVEQIAQAEARRDAQRDQVAFLKAEKEKRFTKAPFAGIIVREFTQRGQWLAKADPVVTVADILEEVHVIANVDQRDLPYVQVGAEVELEIEATAQKKWKGTVITIVPRSDWESGSRTFPVKVAVKNVMKESGSHKFPTLTEGMLARVTFKGPPHLATLVPKDAIVRSEAGSKLFVVLGDPEKPDTGKAKPVMLQEGSFFGNRVEILSSDLQPGMSVVIEGAERLQPFASVQILSDKTTAPVATAPEAPAPSDSTTPKN